MITSILIVIFAAHASNAECPQLAGHYEACSHDGPQAGAFGSVPKEIVIEQTSNTDGSYRYSVKTPGSRSALVTMTTDGKPVPDDGYQTAYSCANQVLTGVMTRVNPALPVAGQTSRHFLDTNGNYIYEMQIQYPGGENSKVTTRCKRR